MRLPVLLAMILGLAAPATAGDLSVVLKGAGGRPIMDAVVMVKPQGGSRAPVRFPWPLRMAQKDMKFEPFVLIVPVGAEVAFPNLDTVRHHVYSFSPAKTFELKLYSRQETRMVRFERPGVVGLGCNIHDDMSAFIRVVDTPYAGKTAANGTLVLHDIPAGAADIVIWHPYQRAPGGEVARKLAIPAAGAASLNLALNLRPPPVPHGGY